MMKEISIIAKLANIKDIEDLVKIEQDRGEDFVVGAGDFNIDSRSSETTYESVKSVLKDTREEYLGSEHMHDQALATYGNKANTYSSWATPLVYDYFWHKSTGKNSISIKQFKVPILKTKKGISFSNHEAVEATFALAKGK